MFKEESIYSDLINTFVNIIDDHITNCFINDKLLLYNQLIKAKNDIDVIKEKSNELKNYTIKKEKKIVISTNLTK